VALAESSKRQLARLLRAARGGDQAALGDLLETQRRLVGPAIRGRVPEAGLGDILQEVFLAAWQILSEPRCPHVARFERLLLDATMQQIADYRGQAGVGVRATVGL
jgi:DNA-directed RNA polymerase specialized sigma24 family protein